LRRIPVAKKKSKRTTTRKVVLKGETHKIIKSLAATLVHTVLKSTKAQKAQIGKEFTRAYDIMTRSLTKSYAQARGERRRHLENLSETLAQQDIIQNPICCLGFPDINDANVCIDQGGTWVCGYDPIPDTETDL
jgi:hypothetical protein